MAVSLTACTLPLSEPSLFRPETSRALRIPIYRFRFQNTRSKSLYRTRLRALREERAAVVKEEEKEDSLSKEAEVFDLNGNGRSFNYNKSLGSSSDIDAVGVNANGAANGSLVKYVRSNGAATKSMTEASTPETEKGTKKTIEEIGQEDAWFKSSGMGKVEQVDAIIQRETVQCDCKPSGDVHHAQRIAYQ